MPARPPVSRPTSRRCCGWRIPAYVDLIVASRQALALADVQNRPISACFAETLDRRRPRCASRASTAPTVFPPNIIDACSSTEAGTIAVAPSMRSWMSAGCRRASLPMSRSRFSITSAISASQCARALFGCARRSSSLRFEADADTTWLLSGDSVRDRGRRSVHHGPQWRRAEPGQHRALRHRFRRFPDVLCRCPGCRICTHMGEAGYEGSLGRGGTEPSIDLAAFRHHIESDAKFATTSTSCSWWRKHPRNGGCGRRAPGGMLQSIDEKNSPLRQTSMPRVMLTISVVARAR